MLLWSEVPGILSIPGLPPGKTNARFSGIRSFFVSFNAAKKELLLEKQRAEKEFLKTARNMLSNGPDTAAVMSFTGLSADEVAVLKSEQ